MADNNDLSDFGIWHMFSNKILLKDIEFFRSDNILCRNKAVYFV